MNASQQEHAAFLQGQEVGHCILLLPIIYSCQQFFFSHIHPLLLTLQCAEEAMAVQAQRHAEHVQGLLAERDATAARQLAEISR